MSQGNSSTAAPFLHRPLRAGLTSRLLIPVALTALLAACGGAPAGKTKAAATTATADSVEQGVPIGEDLMKEPCRLTTRLVKGKVREDLGQDIRCGTSKRPSGDLLATSIAATADLANPREFIAAMIPRTTATQDLASRAVCQPEKWVTLASGFSLNVSRCTIRLGGWPAVAVSALVGRELYQADGIPSALPAMIAAIRAKSGEDTAPGATSPAPAGQPGAAKAGAGPAIAFAPDDLKLIETALDGPLPMFSAAELNAYDDLGERARIYNSTEDFGQAEAAWRKALEVQSRLLGENDVGIGETVENLALEVSNQGRYEEADGLFRRAEPILQKSTEPLAYAKFLGYLAFHAANQKQYTRALATVRDAIGRALAIANESGDQDNAGGQASPFGADALGEIARDRLLETAMALRTQNLAGAEKAATLALKTVETSNTLPQWWRPNILSVLGGVYAAQGRTADAEKTLMLAIELRRGLFASGWPIANAQMDLGKFYAESAQPERAADAYREAFKILAADEAKHPSIRYDQIAPYLGALATLAEKETDATKRQVVFAEMFRTYQVVREGVAGQTIERASARLAAGDGPIGNLVRDQLEAARQRDSLQLELAYETAKPDAERDKARVADLQAKLDEAGKKASALTERIKTEFPNFEKLSQARPIEASELGSLLGPNEGLVAFTFGEDNGFAFFVTREGVTASKLTLSLTDLNEAVTNLREAFKPREGRVLPYDLAGANALYKQLFSGFTEQMSKVTHLVVIPAGALSSLPPSLLVTKPVPAGSVDFKNAAWLVKSTASSLAPSVRAFHDLRKLKATPAAPLPFYGYGNPTFRGPAPVAQGAEAEPSGLEALGAQCRVGQPLPPEIILSLNPLPETADELKRVATILGAPANTVALSKDATVTAVVKNDLSKYRVLYFATHGLLPGELRCQSEPGLALSPPPNGSTLADDGLLSASKIAELKLNASLVVLSACNTGGSGGKFGGGALSGLAEAFFYAGARSMLVSHWSVPSVQTVQLMTGMFERLGPELKNGASESMRQSQLVLIADEKTAHPYFWAAFTLVGDGGKSDGQIAMAQP